MDDASSAFSGVAFHCYAGNFTQQDSFHNAFPGKEVYFTECTGEYGSDWWTDVKVCTCVSSPNTLLIDYTPPSGTWRTCESQLHCCATRGVNMVLFTVSLAP